MRVLAACIASSVLLSCNNQLIQVESSNPDQVGEVSIELVAEERVEILTKAAPEVSVDDFWVEIFTSDQIRIHRQLYSEMKQAQEGSSLTIPVNAGDYTLLAKYGDSLGTGFNKPFYMAKEQFTVMPRTKQTVKTTAKLSNVQLAVQFGENIEKDYTGYYAVVKHNTIKKKSVKFNPGETRYGYIPAGELVLEVYAEVDGELKYFALEPQVYNPNYFVTFNIDTQILYGGLTVNILIDTGTELIEKSEEIPFNAVSSTIPKINLSSFDHNNNFFFNEKEQTEVDELSFSFSALAGLKSCVLETESEYLQNLGVPASIDLKAATAEQIAALEELGFFWAEFDNVGVLDLADLIPAMSSTCDYPGKDQSVATLTLTVTDITGNWASETVQICAKPDVEVEFAIADYDVWGSKVAGLQATVTKGNTSLISIKYSTDGINWSDLGDPTVNGNTLEFADATGLQPGTTYKFAVFYDDWINAKELTVTTEEAQQVDNPGFEVWTTYTYAFKAGIQIGDYDFGSDKYQDWWVPYAISGDDSDTWWAVNSKLSMPAMITMLTNTRVKCFPTVSFSTQRNSGSRSAHIYVVNVGNANTAEVASGTDYIGELFIGKANADGNHSSDGHAFGSRPSALKFHYRYEPRKEEKFYVKAEIKAEDGTVLAVNEITNGPSSSSWSEYVLPLNYTVKDKKAASIFISFKASTASNPSVSAGSKKEIAGSEQEAHFGSSLYIDDIQLLY